MSAVLERYGSLVGQVYDRAEQVARDGVSAELRVVVMQHLATMRQSKGVRPAMVFAASQAAERGFSYGLLNRAACVQLCHEATLVMDDVLDHSKVRRGAKSLYWAYGQVIATAAAAELSTCAMELVDAEAEARALCRTLIRAISVAESVQEWERQGARPLPIATWSLIAQGDTGGLFNLALGLGGVEPFGCPLSTALAYLRHGIDDVDDILDEDGDQADVRDRVPTLLTCFTADDTREGLLEAVPKALDFLDGWADWGRMLRDKWLATFGPFFADFAADVSALRTKATAAGLLTARQI